MNTTQLRSFLFLALTTLLLSNGTSLLPGFEAHLAWGQSKKTKKAPIKKKARRVKKKRSARVAEKPSTVSTEDLSLFTVDPDLSTVTLRMSHSITGRFETYGKGALTGSITVEKTGPVTSERLEFKPDSFESLISLRDQHIKEDYLETAKHPLVILENIRTVLARKDPLLMGTAKDLQNLSPTESLDLEDPKEKVFKGNLIVKGKKIPVEGKAKVYLEEDVLKGEASFNAKVSDFPVKTPNYMGVGVLDEFTILVDFVARPDIGDEDLPADL